MTPNRFVMALALALPVGIAAHAAGAEDKAIEVIVAARSAMGGSKLEGGEVDFRHGRVPPR